ncbi:hypothetical protein AN641_08610 [Candidatus Epulonipiscioides gigas]|nr:hypothetical protein AN641_08610 [Epulopiscium sp. SCG-C07WGA-EpuloA2]
MYKMLFNIAWKNLKNNFGFYSLYFGSVSLVISIFFCLMSFSKNHAISNKISSSSRVELMCNVVAIFVIAFVIFYMTYSNKFFVERRMKELGIYLLLGYSKPAIFLLLIIENIFIGAISLIIGVICGTILHKGIVMLIVYFMGLSIDVSSIIFINNEVVLITAIFITLVTLFVNLSNVFILAKVSLLDLVRIEKKFDKIVTPRLLTGIIGFTFLTLGYMLALNMTQGKNSLWSTIGFSPMALLTIFLVISGTILGVYSFIPMCLKFIKNKSKIFFREITIIIVPKFLQKVRLNSKALIILILLSAGTLTICEVSTLTYWYPIASVDRIIASAIEFKAQNIAQKDLVTNELLKYMNENEFEVIDTHIVRATASSENLPIEYSVAQDKGRIPSFECISYQSYINLLQSQGKEGKEILNSSLNDNEVILIKYRGDVENKDLGAMYLLNGAHNVKVIETSLNNPIGFNTSIGTLVVSDSLFEQLTKTNNEIFSVISINGENLRNSEIVYNVINDLLSDDIYLGSAYKRVNDIQNENSVTFLLVIFATVIFLIAIGSILYFQNLSSIIYSKNDFDILAKVGYSEAKLKHIIRKQIRLYFSIPYIIGALHSLFAVIVFKYALINDILGNTNIVIIPILIGIIIFSIVYFIYYQITKFSCYKVIS